VALAFFMAFLHPLYQPLPLEKLQLTSKPMIFRATIKQALPLLHFCLQPWLSGAIPNR